MSGLLVFEVWVTELVDGLTESDLIVSGGNFPTCQKMDKGTLLTFLQKVFPQLCKSDYQRVQPILD